MIRFLHRKPRILVLDDDVAMQKLMRTLLQREGYSVDVVSKGRDALEAIDRADYAAILLDLMMPTEGGMTVIRRLREKKAGLLRRVIVVTATPESVVKSLAGDVFAVVQKPFQPEELADGVRSLLRS
jgi:DNA-binding response OmpR family regulator